MIMIIFMFIEFSMVIKKNLTIVRNYLFIGVSIVILGCGSDLGNSLMKGKSAKITEKDISSELELSPEVIVETWNYATTVSGYCSIYGWPCDIRNRGVAIALLKKYKNIFSEEDILSAWRRSLSSENCGWYIGSFNQVVLDEYTDLLSNDLLLESLDLVMKPNGCRIMNERFAIQIFRILKKRGLINNIGVFFEKVVNPNDDSNATEFIEMILKYTDINISQKEIEHLWSITIKKYKKSGMEIGKEYLPIFRCLINKKILLEETLLKAFEDANKPLEWGGKCDAAFSNLIISTGQLLSEKIIMQEFENAIIVDKYGYRHDAKLAISIIETGQLSTEFILHYWIKEIDQDSIKEIDDVIISLAKAVLAIPNLPNNIIIKVWGKVSALSKYGHGVVSAELTSLILKNMELQPKYLLDLWFRVTKVAQNEINLIDEKMASLVLEKLSIEQLELWIDSMIANKEKLFSYSVAIKAALEKLAFDSKRPLNQINCTVVPTPDKLKLYLAILNKFVGIDNSEEKENQAIEINHLKARMLYAKRVFELLFFKIVDGVPAYNYDEIPEIMDSLIFWMMEINDWAASDYINDYFKLLKKIAEEPIEMPSLFNTKLWKATKAINKAPEEVYLTEEEKGEFINYGQFGSNLLPYLDESANSLPAQKIQYTLKSLLRKAKNGDTFDKIRIAEGFIEITLENTSTCHGGVSRGIDNAYAMFCANYPNDFLYKIGFEISDKWSNIEDQYLNTFLKTCSGAPANAYWPVFIEEVKLFIHTLIDLRLNMLEFPQDWIRRIELDALDDNNRAHGTLYLKNIFCKELELYAVPRIDVHISFVPKKLIESNRNEIFNLFYSQYIENIVQETLKFFEEHEYGENKKFKNLYEFIFGNILEDTLGEEKIYFVNKSLNRQVFIESKDYKEIILCTYTGKEYNECINIENSLIEGWEEERRGHFYNYIITEDDAMRILESMNVFLSGDSMGGNKMTE